MVTYKLPYVKRNVGPGTSKKGCRQGFARSHFSSGAYLKTIARYSVLWKEEEGREESNDSSGFRVINDRYEEQRAGWRLKTGRAKRYLTPAPFGPYKRSGSGLVFCISFLHLSQPFIPAGPPLKASSTPRSLPASLSCATRHF